MSGTSLDLQSKGTAMTSANHLTCTSVISSKVTDDAVLRCVKSAAGRRQHQLCLRLARSMQFLLARKMSGTAVKKEETLGIKKETEVFGQVFRELVEDTYVKFSTDMKDKEMRLECGKTVEYRQILIVGLICHDQHAWTDRQTDRHFISLQYAQMLKPC